jgi:tripartite ATP-independent transporter DctP family solute receptor
MQVNRRALLQTAGSAALVGLSTRSAFAQPGTFNYKVASNVPTTHPIYIRLTEAVEKIKAETAGKVVISIFPNGQLGSDTDMLSQVRSGGIDFLTMPGVVLANLVPMASLNSVGFIFPDYATVWKAMDGDFGKHIRKSITQANLVVFDKVWDNGFRQISSSRPIASASDMLNLKIRVPVSPLLLSLFKSLGSSPTPINFNELYSALQTKIVDAQENALSLFTSAKLYEVQKYVSLTGHTWDGYWFLANKRSFEALPANLREIVMRNIDAAALNQRADGEKQAVSLQADLTAKGLTISKPDIPSFRAALQKAGFYKEWKGKFGDEAWAQLEAVAGKLA